MVNINEINGLNLSALIVFALPASAQPALKFPDKSVRIIVASPAGSSTDIAARLKFEVAKYAQIVKQSGVRVD